MRYQWTPGYRASVKAQLVGRELERIRKAHQGRLVPAEVVEESRPEGAPLHKSFEWDNNRAGQLHREEQARRIIRSIRVIDGGSLADNGEPSKPEICYIHVTPDGDDPCYMTSAHVMNDDDLRDQALEDAIDLLRGVKARYEHLEELAEVFKVIDKVAGKLGRKKKPQPA